MKAFSLLIAISWLSFASDPVLPDKKLTPGAILTSNATITCVSGYAGKTRNVPDSVKRKVFIAYFGVFPSNRKDYEVDHLISLELGGSNDIKNLWPQSYVTSPLNAHIKDRLEDWMAESVKSTLKTKGPSEASALLSKYQKEIATNWVAAYKKYIGK